MADLSALSALTTPEQQPWPDDLAPEAKHGIIGKIVKFIAPETEADEAGLHATIAIATGNVIGRNPYFPIGADHHHPALYGCLVGPTSGGKGMATGLGKSMVKPADTEWAKNRLVDGLSTGEGLIFHVRDPQFETRLAKEEEADRADSDGMITDPIDPGIADKRVLVSSGEFAQTLTAAGREGNTLSPILRSLWDDGNAGSLTRSAPIRTTGAHVSIIANITKEELGKKMTATESANGFGNRFFWVCVKRARKLPLGGNLRDEDLDPLKQELTEAIRDARRVGEMGMSLTAQGIWSTAYNDELTTERDGLFGAITGRASAISLRLSVLFAALDGSHVIEADHVEAALATWRRAEQSAAYLFGGHTGDQFTDRIKGIILNAGQEGIRRSEIRKALGSNNFSTERIINALDSLEESGVAIPTTEETAGRAAERWFAVQEPINPNIPSAGATG